MTVLLPTPRAARLAQKFSIRELARLACVSKSTVERAEKRGMWPRNHNVCVAYKTALGVGAGP